jgi:4-alpha-glucanotransferase
VTDPRTWGIEEGYQDVFGHWHGVPQETITRVLRAMETDDASQPGDAALLIVTEGVGSQIDGAAEMELEDGSRFRVENSLPADLPLGYHQLRNLEDGRQLRVIVTPAACYLPANLRIWGWALQLYSLRSHSSWGIGDLEDLRRFSAWASQECGAEVIMINPLGANNGLPQQSSPYYPSSRLFLNPLYMCIERVPGAREALENLESLAMQGRLLSEQPLIDRDEIYRLKMSALEAIWIHTRKKVDISTFERERGSSLEQFAAFCTLAERYGANWRIWPERYRLPESPALSELPAELADRVRFHKWLQWLLDLQMKEGSGAQMIMQDLPIGVDPQGADAWMWQNIFAKGVSVGAPPDEFNSEGQDWGLPPFIPHRLRAAGYKPFIETVRSTMRHSLALRIDHVMGLFRLFWIPAEGPKKNGTYVRYRADELLSILALESARAQAFVVGEDLGTVDDGVRAQLARFRILSYRLMWFEDNFPEQYPQLALAAVSTHDLPTIAGVWSGADLNEQESLGLTINRESSTKLRNRLKQIANVEDSSPLPVVVTKMHEALSHAPSAVILASIDDALGVERRPNLPGTTDSDRSNWCIPLPKKLEEIKEDPMVLEIAQCLRRRSAGAKIIDEDAQSANMA